MSNNTFRTDSEANIHYRFPDMDELIENTDKLLSVIEHHRRHQVPRLNMLLDYYRGDNTGILNEPRGKRRKEKSLADKRITSNFGRYVSEFIQGFMVGEPVKLAFTEEGHSEDVINYIHLVNNRNHADEVNSDIALDQSIFGRAYELVYRVEDKSGDTLTKFIDLDARTTFVIYDTTVDRNPIGAVRYIKHRFSTEEIVHLYTKNELLTYELEQGELSLVDREDHHFGEVPIIECENNKFREGDFENVIRYIDAYDSALSDTANYMEDLNDAMLKIAGDVDLSSDEASEMKDANIMLARPNKDSEGKVSPTPDVDYIYKKYDVQGSEAYKTRLADDILKFTSMPDLTNYKSSSGGDSASAMRMRVFGLKQKRGPKVQMFKKFLYKRYELIANMASKASESTFDPSDIQFIFTENHPNMIEQEMEWFINAGGRLSDKTMWEQLSIVEDSEEEAKRIAAEDASYYERREREKSGFDFPFADLADEVGEDDE